MVVKKESKEKIITTYNAKQGYWYVHTDSYYWDSEKKQTRHKRKTIGKKLIENGPIIYNSRYLLEHPEIIEKQERATKVSPRVSTTKSLGEIRLLDSVVRDLGLRKHLTKAFNKNKSDKIIALAEYLICTEKALSWAGSWADDKDLAISNILSQDVSKILESLSTDERTTFSQEWIKAHKCKKGYFCFDSTNISSYSTTASPHLDYGYAHGHISRPQINLAILSRQDNFTPVQSLLYNGSTHDSTTINSLIEGLNKLELQNIIITLDRGYYSQNNIKTIMESHNSFIMPVPKRVLWQYKEIDTVKTELNSVKASVDVERDNGEIETIYCVRKLVKREGHRFYLYVVYNPQVRSDEEIRFRALMRNCYDELLSGALLEAHSVYYERFFEVKETPKRGRQVTEKFSLEEEFNKKYAGYWCLLSNEKRDRSEIYHAYSQRNTAELFYDILKNDLNGDMVRSHNNKTFEGKMFITFIALIILSKLKKKFAELRVGNKTLNRVKSYRELLFKMSSLTEVSFSEKYKPMYSRPTKIQAEVIDKFDVNWPI